MKTKCTKWASCLSILFAIYTIVVSFMGIYKLLGAVRKQQYGVGDAYLYTLLMVAFILLSLWSIPMALIVMVRADRKPAVLYGKKTNLNIQAWTWGLLMILNAIILFKVRTSEVFFEIGLYLLIYFVLLCFVGVDRIYNTKVLKKANTKI